MIIFEFNSTNMDRALRHVQDNLRLAEEKIDGLEKERAIKDLCLLSIIAELRSLQTCTERAIGKATEALQTVCEYNVYCRIIKTDIVVLVS